MDWGNLYKELLDGYVKTYGHAVDAQMLTRNSIWNEIKTIKDFFKKFLNILPKELKSKGIYLTTGLLHQKHLRYLIPKLPT